MTDDRKARTEPTKSFFVNMLTRDIELKDAILDLLDNCIDGAVRSAAPLSHNARPYDGYWASMAFSQDSFCIQDNCGGIPIEIALNSAFRLGRPQHPEQADSDGRTVGVYGIGMKRAIFKLGRSAQVVSNGTEPFEVLVSPEWMDSEQWDPFELVDINPNTDTPKGTSVMVNQLHASVKKDLMSKDWIENFKRYIANHYALIISKGFEVRIEAMGVSSDPIKAAEFALAVSGDLGGGGVQPYIYQGEMDGVSINIFAGLLQKPLNSQEIAVAEVEPGDKSLAGWTIACNDRVVVSRDRTFLTGWGTGGVPQYHGQYSVIAGIVILSASEVDKLPLTTTKRGLDGSSPVYAMVLEIMREATKKLTAFTNAYKTDEDRRELLDEAPKKNLAELRTFEKLSVVTSGRFSGFKVMRPNLPQPPRKSTIPRISFKASKAEISSLRVFFEDDDLTNNEVGREAFDYVLNTAGYSGE